MRATDVSNLQQCLAAAGIETVLANPLRSRRFAEALGRLPPCSPRSACSTTSLRPCPGRRTSTTSATCSLSATSSSTSSGPLRKLCAELDPQTAECSAATLDALRAGIAPCEQRMLECIAADAVLSRRTDIIGLVPCRARLTAACLCADMPELGTLGRRQVASLLGLAR